MGLSLFVVLANVCMKCLDESVLESCVLRPTIQRRYADDTLSCSCMARRHFTNSTDASTAFVRASSLPSLKKLESA